MAKTFVSNHSKDEQVMRVRSVAGVVCHEKSNRSYKSLVLVRRQRPQLHAANRGVDPGTVNRLRDPSNNLERSLKNNSYVSLPCGPRHHNSILSSRSLLVLRLQRFNRSTTCPQKHSTKEELEI
jgi:hypothetical protein